MIDRAADESVQTVIVEIIPSSCRKFLSPSASATPVPIAYSAASPEDSATVVCARE